MANFENILCSYGEKNSSLPNHCQLCVSFYLNCTHWIEKLDEVKCVNKYKKNCITEMRKIIDSNTALYSRNTSCAWSFIKKLFFFIFCIFVHICESLRVDLCICIKVRYEFIISLSWFCHILLFAALLELLTSKNFGLNFFYDIIESFISDETWINYI